MFNFVIMEQVVKYKTISGPSGGLYKEKGSKFLSFAYPVETEDQIREIVQRFKKEYYDARHICYAWALGPNREITRMNDDGEPSGTAGRPIYGQILSADVTNLIVLVVRYFGGVLLGTGGLIVAYREATLDALNNAVIKEEDVVIKVEVEFGFPSLNDIMKFVKESESKILFQDYGMECRIVLEITLEQQSLFESKMNKIDGLKFNFLT